MKSSGGRSGTARHRELVVVVASAAEIDARLRGWVDPERPPATERVRLVDRLTGETIERDVPVAPSAAECAERLDPAGLPHARWPRATVDLITGFAEELGAEHLDVLGPELEVEARIGPPGAGRLGCFPDAIVARIA
jgi:hypothetical protein